MYYSCQIYAYGIYICATKGIIMVTCIYIGYIKIEEYVYICLTKYIVKTVQVGSKMVFVTMDYVRFYTTRKKKKFLLLEV